MRAIYAIVENEIKESCWDEDFIKEIENREKSFLDGSAETYTLEEARQAAIERVKTFKK